MKERKSLLEDAKAATQAALAEGIVPGGGVALIRSEKAAQKLDLSGDEALGAKIVIQVLDEPLRVISNNAGLDGADIGKIDIFDMSSYVAVTKSALRQAMNYLADGKVKGRAIRARKIR